MALGVPEDTSNKALKRAENAMAPLVATAMNIVDDYPNKVDGPTSSFPVIYARIRL